MFLNYQKHIIVVFFIFIFLLPSIGYAHEEDELLADRDVLLGEEVYFSAPLDEKDIEYWWNFGDGSVEAEGAYVRHIYRTTGIFTVTLFIKGDNESIEDKAVINVYNSALFLIIGERQDPFALTNFLNSAKKSGFLVQRTTIIKPQSLFAEDDLFLDIIERLNEVKRSAKIIGWTKDSVEIETIARLSLRFRNTAILKDKEIIIVTDKPKETMSRLKFFSYAFGAETLAIILPSSDIEKALEPYDKAREGEFILANESERRFRFGDILIARGLPSYLLYLLLLLPIVIVLVVFLGDVVSFVGPLYVLILLTFSWIIFGVLLGFIIFGAVLFLCVLYDQRFEKIYHEKGGKTLALVLANSVIIAFISFYIIQGYKARAFLLSYPEIVLFCFLALFIRDRWQEVWEICRKYIKYRHAAVKQNIID